MRQFQIGLQLYSVRDALEKDFAQTLRQVKQMGYDGAEFAGLHGHTADEVADLLHQTGLQAVSAHLPLTAFTREWDKTRQDYQTLGCQYLALPGLDEVHHPDHPGYPALLQTLDRVGKVCTAAGMPLLYHNHAVEMAVRKDGMRVLDGLYRDTEKEALQAEPDVCWLRAAGLDPSQWLLEHADRVQIIHVKDFTLPKGFCSDFEKLEPVFAPIGAGMQDWKPILQAATVTAAGWLVVEQDEPLAGHSQLEDAKQSICYLRQLTQNL